MAVSGNGAKMPDPPRPNGAQRTLPGLPAPAAAGSQNKQQPESEADKRKREMRERIEKSRKEREEKEAKEKAEKDKAAKAEPKPEPKPEPKDAETEPVHRDGTMRRFAELLASGGFTRRLTWRERHALRKVERRCDQVRQALHDAFKGAPPEGVTAAMDSLAALEAVARLEMLCEQGE